MHEVNVHLDFGMFKFSMLSAVTVQLVCKNVIFLTLIHDLIIMKKHQEDTVGLLSLVN